MWYSELHICVLILPLPTINNIFDIDFRSWIGVFDSTSESFIKQFVSFLWRVGSFHWLLLFPSVKLNLMVRKQNEIWNGCYTFWVRVRMFNATFSNISVISWWSVLLVEETRVPRENLELAASHWHFVFTTKVTNFYSKLVPDQKWNTQRRDTTKARNTRQPCTREWRTNNDKWKHPTHSPIFLT